MILCNALVTSHLLISKCLKPGDIAVDATAGNGHDTEFLSGLVGDGGKVYSFDIQEKALEVTRRNLRKKNMLSNVVLINDGHENAENYLSGLEIGGAMFNLGYLPGGEQRVITLPLTTVLAVKAVSKLLKKNGLITIVLYSGHPGGMEEKEMLLLELSGFNQKDYQVARYTFINQIKHPPELFIIEKI